MKIIKKNNYDIIRDKQDEKKAKTRTYCTPNNEIPRYYHKKIIIFDFFCNLNIIQK
jgi:hypothetical protein